MTAQFVTLSASTIDQVEIALSLVIILALILHAVSTQSAIRHLREEAAYLQAQLNSEGCYAFRSGKLMISGGPLEKFHRQAHAHGGHDPAQVPYG